MRTVTALGLMAVRFVSFHCTPNVDLYMEIVTNLLDVVGLGASGRTWRRKSQSATRK